MQKAKEDICEMGRQLWGKWAECWTNAFTPDTDIIDLDVDSQITDASLLYLNIDFDEDDIDSDAAQLFIQTYLQTDDASENEENQDVFLIVDDFDEPYIFEQVEEE